MTGAGRLAERLRELGEERLLAVVRTEALGTALRSEAAAKRLASARLAVRTGRLRNSIAGLVEDEPDAFLIKLRATVPYARIQEQGGTVKPVRGQWLAIPNSRTAAGVARNASPRDVPGLRFVKFRGDLAAWVRGGGREGPMQVVFWLVKQVTIKGTYYLRDGLDEGGKELTERLAKRVKALLEAGEA